MKHVIAVWVLDLFSVWFVMTVGHLAGIGDWVTLVLACLTFLVDSIVAVEVTEAYWDKRAAKDKPYREREKK